jgi:NADH-quinone oxidoreductase subunit M
VIAGWGGPDRRRAARKFVLYTLFGSVLLLLGVITVTTAAGTGDLITLAGGAGLSRTTQYVAFALFAVAFAVKAPLWPLHTWLPDAHTQAPTVGSVILAGVLLKMGTYGLIRIGVGVTPLGAAWAAPALGVLAAAAILAGSLICLRQTELKRLIAYSSVGHMGFVLLGIATLTVTGLQAALLGNVAHGLITGLLFFLAGAIKDRAHTGELADLGGLRETAPRLAGLLGFAAIASLGLPGLAGFWGEAFAVVGAIERGGGLWLTLAAVAAVGGALTAAYFLRLLRQVTHGPAAPAVRTLRPAIAGAEWLAWAPLMVLVLAVGLVPALVLAATSAPMLALTGVLR